MTDGRRSLQIAVSLGALVPLLAGAAGVILGPGMLANESISTIAMDSHYRYLSGLLLGIGIGFWTTIPNIETKTARFQLLGAIVFLGGLGRLYSLLTVGMPDHMMLFGLTMELIITPLFVMWQAKVAKSCHTSKSGVSRQKG